jgi:hypothetical protein
MTNFVFISHLLQRTFVGVDSFRIFQEVYLRIDDRRVVNVVRFSESVGDLKVEVIYMSIHLNCDFTWYFIYLDYSYLIQYLLVIFAAQPCHFCYCL